MSTLADLQRDFQRHVMWGDTGIEQAVSDTPEVPATTRLSIYAQAYRLRLTDALATTMPCLQQLLGEEEFTALATRYIEAWPSRFASIRWFGDQLSRLLERSHPRQPWLAELAQWEWGLASAFDAADATPLQVDALAGIAPEDWPSLSFVFHPSIQRLPMRTNAPLLFKALAEEATPPDPVGLADVQWWLVWRLELKTQYRSLERAEAAALESMCRGGTFESLCDVLCEWHAEEAVPVQAAGMLKRWVVDGLIVDKRND